MASQHVRGLRGVRGASCLAGYELVGGKSEAGETERSPGGHTGSLTSVNVLSEKGHSGIQIRRSVAH